MTLREIEKKIEEIKRELSSIKKMRPGSLSQRYNVCGVKNCKCKDPKNPQKHGPYVQLSFVHHGKNTTRHIRKPFMKKIKKETAQYRIFKDLINQWIALEIERSDIEMKLKIVEIDKSSSHKP